MKILLVDNHTDYLHNFSELFLNHSVEIQTYQPGLSFHTSGKDLVILSGGGGEGFELSDTRHGRLWYEDEMNFVLNCDKPLLGICMGFEIIAAAYGSKASHIGHLVQGFKTQTTSKLGQKNLKQTTLSQYEHHRYAIKQVSSKHFEVMADSSCGLEMIKHKSKKIMASQFHPEVLGGTIELAQMLYA